MAQRLTLASLALSALLAASWAYQPAHAQALGDPMRPPAAASPGKQIEAGRAARLQSVLTSHGRSVAVIDGRSVRLGERVGDAKVVAISPTEVTLQIGAERQVLKLHSAIEKKPALPRAPRHVNP